MAARAEAEQSVTPLELFFDLVFVLAITQATSLLADDPTWGGVLEGMLVLAALWWAWAAYAWPTNTLDADEGGPRLAMLAAMGAMLIVSLAVPGAFGDDAAVFAVGYLLVLALLPAARELPAPAALALVAAVCASVVAYEALRYRELRAPMRHPEPVG